MELLVVWHRLIARGRDDHSEPGAIKEWSRAARARIVAAGGRIAAQVSGTLVATFEPADATDVLEMALDLVDAALDESVSIAIGIAFGHVEDDTGRAFEAAELLASRAQPGEIVLDPHARERVEGLFLFGRSVSTGVGGPRGSSIDRAHPRLIECGEGIARLSPAPIAPVTAQLVEGLVQTLRKSEPPAVVLRGPVGAGAVELVTEAARAAKPRALMHVGSAPGGIVPLASLRYGLARTFGSDDEICGACGATEAGKSAARVLRIALRGGLPPLDALADALAHFFAAGGAQERVWAFVTPLATVDLASLEVLLACRARGAPLAIIARYPVDLRLPAGVEGVSEIMLPPLHTSDARVIAETVLGEATDPEVARRVAVLGGETPLGVLEVARALIASGDLVLEGDAFAWRGAPRTGVAAVALEEVVEERLSRLDDESRRVLEAVCVAPEGAARDLIESIAQRDGVGEKARARALERLTREAWLSVPTRERLPERPQSSSTFVRRFVIQVMPPSRHAELHRFVADALVERGAEDAALPSLSAELGWYEIEGGRDAPGSARLFAVAKTAVDRGYRRASYRIGGWLKKVGATEVAALNRASATLPPPSGFEDEAGPPSSEVMVDPVELSARAAAASMPSLLPPHAPREASRSAPSLSEESGAERGGAKKSESAGSQPSHTEDTQVGRAGDGSGDGEALPISSFVSAAEDAVRRRDLEALDRLVQRAVLSGSDMGAVARFRALADLLRGDVGSARRALAKARGYKRGPKHKDPREALAEAVVALGSGDPGAAIRLGLRALSIARRAADRRGENAAMRTLAVCFRALGRDADATAIERALG